MERPDWIQRFAFEAENVEALLRAKGISKERRAGFVGPHHDDFVLSIYFFGPFGHRLELAARLSPPKRRLEREAPEVLALWEQTHDRGVRRSSASSQGIVAREEAS